MNKPLNKKMIIIISTAILVLLLVASGIYYYGLANKDRISVESKFYKIDLFCERVNIALSFTRYQIANKEIDLITERISEFNLSQEKNVNLDKNLTEISNQVRRSQNKILKVKNENQKASLFSKYFEIILPFLAKISKDEKIKSNDIVSEISSVVMEGIESLDEEAKKNINEKFRENLDSISTGIDIETNNKTDDSKNTEPSDGTETIEKLTDEDVDRIVVEVAGDNGIADKAKVNKSKGYFVTFILDTFDKDNDSTIVVLSQKTSSGIKNIWIKDGEDLYGIDPAALISGTALTSSEMDWLINISASEDQSSDKIFYQ